MINLGFICSFSVETRVKSLNEIHFFQFVFFTYYYDLAPHRAESRKFVKNCFTLFAVWSVETGKDC